jgi:glutamine amidotransferase
MLAVVDYGAGNLRSVLHALGHLGASDVRLARTPDDLTGVDKIILPGVGAFGAGMNQLRDQGLIEPLREAVARGVPYLGICLGMQFLFERSDEMGDHAGLSVLPGIVTRIPEQPGLKVPHMGWNELRATRPSPLLDGIATDAGTADAATEAERRYAYFVHSYHCVPTEPGDVLAVVDYGAPVVAAVQRGSIYGVQFHPEKSQKTGLRLLDNFLKLPIMEGARA